ncbi:UDP-glucose--hexose-1-phosphate uridylyltransferase [Enterococcus xiangfangensis]|uniref:Galactose-1-phosphate uridylyltransferase n=1 Tax=Enterococcus xiangfangensis TaxID=1296537 RepID=A0ABU3F6G5_9ENTE|nr:UDP-glucose--hexose-1-phosphate uridylyltransferase [Enterococcus xiangfangensis]MDT2758254.1 UDP-glucose--hexose-1-phosphate uridylyltransferase [Enterococcus xiangfangensis]
MSISQTIRDFITLAIQSGGWMEMDRLYLENRVIAMIGEDALTKVEVQAVAEPAIALVEQLLGQAQKNQVITGLQAEKERLEAQLMDLMTPPPSVVNAYFAQYYSKDPIQATDYFFNLSKETNYVKTRENARNSLFSVETEYGQLEMMIDFSKIENDQEAFIAKQTVTDAYPKCVFCMENEGYKGRANYPARSNQRIIRMNLDGESWGFQYAPNAHYTEQCIIASEEHRPLKTTKATFQRLLKIVEVLPHYFVGSDADLPIVGGSKTAHAYYQGGRHAFPLAAAEIERPFTLQDFPSITAGIVKWPMSVIRLQGKKQRDLVEAANKILTNWQTYSDEPLEIIAQATDGTQHHTITPIARRTGDHFELDLVLRDNNVSAEFPDGIFHLHPEVQHIKKGILDLNDVMGSAVLAPHLETELKEVEQYLLGQENTLADYHQKWADQLKTDNQITVENVTEIVQKAVGKIFVRGLEDAGVFKRDSEGQLGFLRFIHTL